MDGNKFLDALANKIAALEQELNAFVEDANRQIVAQQGAITALCQLRDELRRPSETAAAPEQVIVEEEMTVG